MKRLFLINAKTKLHVLKVGLQFRRMIRILSTNSKPSTHFFKRTLLTNSLAAVKFENQRKYERKQMFSTGNKPRGQGKMGVLASIGVGASLLLGKTKYVLVALKLTKAAPALSMVLTSLTYSLFFGVPYAIGMVGLIFCHECGHAIVMHRYGVPFSPMVFVPFMGAVIAMEDKPRNVYEEAMIAFGGPVAGSAAALALGTLASMNDSQLLYALADFGYMINLFNLMPIGSMDGGRIGNAISPWVGVGGLALGGWMILEGAIVNPLFYLIMLSGAYSTGSRFWNRHEYENQRYHRIPKTDQAKIVAGYLALIGALIYAMRDNNKHRKTPKQLEAEKRGHHVYTWEDERQQDGVYDDFFGSDSSKRW